MDETLLGGGGGGGARGPPAAFQIRLFCILRSTYAMPLLVFKPS